MKQIELEDWLVENIGDVLLKIEMLFNINFEYNEVDIKDLRDLDKLVLNKIQKESDTVCTTQKAFYQLRNVLDKLNLYDADKLKPDTTLKEIIPQKNRRKIVKQINDLLGYNSNILCPNFYIVISACITFIVFIFFSYFDWTTRLTSMGVSSLILYLSIKYQRNLNFKNIRILLESTVENNYLDIRKNIDTINRNEIKNLIRKWLSEAIDYDIKKDENINFYLKK